MSVNPPASNTVSTNQEDFGRADMNMLSNTTYNSMMEHHFATNQIMHKCLWTGTEKDVLAFAPFLQETMPTLHLVPSLH